MRAKKILNANEMLDILASQWATRKDVQALSGAGYNTSIEIFSEIEKYAIDKGYYLPQGRPKIVPMELVVEYLKINVNYLRKMAKGSDK